MKAEQAIKNNRQAIDVLIQWNRVIGKLDEAKANLVELTVKGWRNSEMPIYKVLGRVKVFNGQSVRLEVLASEKHVPNYRNTPDDKKNWESFNYGMIQEVKTVPKDDVPLYLGFEFRSVALEKALSNKK